MIKRNLGPILITFLIFAAVTIYTGKFMAHVDGWDIIGFHWSSINYVGVAFQVSLAHILITFIS